METWDAIRSRRNVRTFTDRPVGTADLERILEAARRTPSSSNRQRWDFVVVTDRERLRRLAGVWRGAGHIAGSAATVALIAPQADDPHIRESIQYDLGQVTMSVMLAAADTFRAAAVEQLHPEVNFVSEIGGEDMKTLFFRPAGDGRGKQVFMQSACSGGTGTFVEKTARKLHITTEQLAAMPYEGMTLHKVSSKCGIFAEADANSLVKSGVPVEEIIASLFEAVVHQNLATLTKGNVPMPGVLLLGGPLLHRHGLRVVGVVAGHRVGLVAGDHGHVAVVARGLD